MGDTGMLDIWDISTYVFERLYVCLGSLNVTTTLTFLGVILAGVFVSMLFKLFFDRLG